MQRVFKVAQYRVHYILENCRPKLDPERKTSEFVQPMMSFDTEQLITFFIYQYLKIRVIEVNFRKQFFLHLVSWKFLPDLAKDSHSLWVQHKAPSRIRRRPRSPLISFSQIRSVKPIDCTEFSTRHRFFQICRVLHLFVVKMRKAHLFFFLNNGWMSTLLEFCRHLITPTMDSRENFLKSFF